MTCFFRGCSIFFRHWGQKFLPECPQCCLLCCWCAGQTGRVSVSPTCLSALVCEISPNCCNLLCKQYKGVWRNWCGRSIAYVIAKLHLKCVGCLEKCKYYAKCAINMTLEFKHIRTVHNCCYRCTCCVRKWRFLLENVEEAVHKYFRAVFALCVKYNAFLLFIK